MLLLLPVPMCSWSSLFHLFPRMPRLTFQSAYIVILACFSRQISRSPDLITRSVDHQISRSLALFNCIMPWPAPTGSLTIFSPFKLHNAWFAPCPHATSFREQSIVSTQWPVLACFKHNQLPFEHPHSEPHCSCNNQHHVAPCTSFGLVLSSRPSTCPSAFRPS